MLWFKIEAKFKVNHCNFYGKQDLAWRITSRFKQLQQSVEENFFNYFHEIHMKPDQHAWGEGTSCKMYSIKLATAPHLFIQQSHDRGTNLNNANSFIVNSKTPPSLKKIKTFWTISGCAQKTLINAIINGRLLGIGRKSRPRKTFHTLIRSRNSYGATYDSPRTSVAAHFRAFHPDGPQRQTYFRQLIKRQRFNGAISGWG